MQEQVKYKTCIKEENTNHKPKEISLYMFANKIPESLNDENDHDKVVASPFYFRDYICSGLVSVDNHLFRLFQIYFIFSGTNS